MIWCLELIFSPNNFIQTKTVEIKAKVAGDDLPLRLVMKVSDLSLVRLSFAYF